ncbi:MAG: TetR/AcrR family transcriptional regulator [Pedosphaera sp.]|nr:TetR/AcrR family transcriptional regulator [Pedosphaera sp.]
MKKRDTKTVILDAAELLFARKGPNGTSLREVIGHARVNLAAIHYHFGSKHELLDAVLSRRLASLNGERLGLLADFEAKLGRRPVSLEQVLHALIAPALRLSRDPRRGGETFMRLLGRCFTEPDERLQQMLTRHFEQVAIRFTSAIQKSLPKLPPVDLFWRIHFMIGAMAHTMADTRRVRENSKGLCDPDNTNEVIARLTAFLSAGFRCKPTLSR